MLHVLDFQTLNYPFKIKEKKLLVIQDQIYQIFMPMSEICVKIDLNIHISMIADFSEKFIYYS